MSSFGVPIICHPNKASICDPQKLVLYLFVVRSSLWHGRGTKILASTGGQHEREYAMMAQSMLELNLPSYVTRLTLTESCGLH